MNKLLLAFLCMAIFYAGQALAQNCPYGIPSAGNPFCVPPPTHPNSPNYQGDIPPPPIWADRWGAIAFDKNTGIYGTSKEMANKRASEEAAIHACRQNGGEACRIHLSYYNQCGVIAWGETFATTASAGSIKEASERAIRNCNEETYGCGIVYSDCSMAKKVQ